MEADFTSNSLAGMPGWQHRHFSFNKPHFNRPNTSAKATHEYRPNPVSTVPIRLAHLRAMKDALGNNATRLTQHYGFPSQPAPSQAPEPLMAPFYSNANSTMDNQAMLFAPSQATSINPFVNARSGGIQEPLTTIQQHPSSRHQKMQQHSFQRLPPHLEEQQQQYYRQLSRTATATPDQLLTPQQTLEQTLRIPDIPFTGLAATHPQLQKSVALGFRSTAQQFASQARTASTPQPQTAHPSLPSPQTTPIRQAHVPQLSPAKSVAIEPQPQVISAESVSAEAAYRNEVAERTRLDQERWQESNRHSERRAELKKDTTALYHNYSEYLKYFPLGRGERASPYLVDLLANQPIPAEQTSDLGLAIQYAKQHWANFWELKDLDYVVRKAKEELERKIAERKTTGDVATAGRKR